MYSIREGFYQHHATTYMTPLGGTSITPALPLIGIARRRNPKAKNVEAVGCKCGFAVQDDWLRVWSYAIPGREK
jgi:hypothetical protein